MVNGNFVIDASSSATKEEFEKAVSIKKDQSIQLTDLSDEDLIRKNKSRLSKILAQ